MADDDALNLQIKDSVAYTTGMLVGRAGSPTAAMLDLVLLQTIGLAMHNAVSAQRQAQMHSAAATAAACARMLKGPVAARTAIEPAVAGVQAVAGSPNTFTVSGSGFVPGLAVEIYQGGALLGTAGGPAITDLTPNSFAMQTGLLSPGGVFVIQVAGPSGRSAPFFYGASNVGH